MTAAPTPLPGRRTPHRSEVALTALVLVLVAVVVLLLVRHDTSQSSGTGVQGSGVAAAQTRELPSFTGLELAGSNIVEVKVGGRQSVVVHADDNLLDRVTTRVRADRLVIGNTSGSITTKSPMYVDVTVPSLDTLTLSGSGTVSVEGIDAERLTAGLPGSGVLRASGSATRLEVTLSGSGDAELGEVVARDVHAAVSGSGRVVVTATDTLDASVSGSGVVVYGGHPKSVTREVTGSGAVVGG